MPRFIREFIPPLPATTKFSKGDTELKVDFTFEKRPL